jgi:hypothetical protein
MSFASYILNAAEAPLSDTAHACNCGMVGSMGHTLCCVRVQSDWFACWSGVDVVHKFNHAIILHLKLWDNMYTFLIIIVGLQVGQTTVVIFLQRIYR